MNWKMNSVGNWFLHGDRGRVIGRVWSDGNYGSSFTAVLDDNLEPTFIGRFYSYEMAKAEVELLGGIK